MENSRPVCPNTVATSHMQLFKFPVCSYLSLSKSQHLVLLSHGCRQHCHNGEAEQRRQAKAAAAFQGRTICRLLGFYSSRDLPGI